MEYLNPNSVHESDNTICSDFLFLVDLVTISHVSNNIGDCIVCVVFSRPMNKRRMITGMMDVKAMCFYLKKIRCLNNIIRLLSHVSLVVSTFCSTVIFK